MTTTVTNANFFCLIRNVFRDETLCGESLTALFSNTMGKITCSFKVLPPHLTSNQKIYEIFKRSLLVLTLALATPLLGLLAFMGLTTKLIHYGHVICCFPKENSDRPEVNKDLLINFNEFFPNIKVVGDTKAAQGQRLLSQLNLFGIRYETHDLYEPSKVPVKVWAHLINENTASTEQKEAIGVKIENGIPLSTEEEELLKPLRGASACFLLHRKVILETIERYNKAVLELGRGSLLSNNDRIFWEAQKVRYSSIFVFEHNTLFGEVKGNGSIDHSKIKGQINQMLDALPSDWEYFSLFVNEVNPAAAALPEELDLPDRPSPLVYPGVGVGTKAFAFSQRIYPELIKLFDEIDEERAIRDFEPVDREFHHLSRIACENDRKRCPQLGAKYSVVYRAAGYSFHRKIQIGTHALFNLGSRIYKHMELPKVTRDTLKKAVS